MLRYLILRERGDFFTTTIKAFFSDIFNTQRAEVYTLFNRPGYIKDLKA
jgi:hypothetical protein